MHLGDESFCQPMIAVKADTRLFLTELIYITTLSKLVGIKFQFYTIPANSFLLSDLGLPWPAFEFLEIPWRLCAFGLTTKKEMQYRSEHMLDTNWLKGGEATEL